jgi:lipopolysaccharide biosynthesis glycosyltransferase
MSGRKKAIFSISLGSDPAYKYSQESMALYANKVGADFINLTSPIYRDLDDTKNVAWIALYQKMHIKKLLDNYESVLYLDADLLVTPNARDIFETFRQDAVYLLNEGHRGREDAINKVSKLFSFSGGWTKTDNFHDYFNAGVILANQGSELHRYLSYAECELSIRESIPYLEQSYLNLVIQRHQIKAAHLPREFNYMENVGSPDGRFSAAFIHYAGNGFRKNGQKRYEVIRSDYFFFYGKPSVARYCGVLVGDYFNYKKVSVARSLKRVMRRLREK